MKKRHILQFLPIFDIIALGLHCAQPDSPYRCPYHISRISHLSAVRIAATRQIQGLLVASMLYSLGPRLRKNDKIERNNAKMLKTTIIERGLLRLENSQQN